MRRKAILLGAWGALLVLTFAGTRWLLTPQPVRSGVTEENVRRIEAGASLEEVEGILGGPGQRVLRTWDPDKPQDHPTEGRRSVWLWAGADGSALVVLSDVTDIVVGAVFHRPDGQTP